MSISVSLDQWNVKINYKFQITVLGTPAVWIAMNLTVADDFWYSSLLGLLASFMGGSQPYFTSLNCQCMFKNHRWQVGGAVYGERFNRLTPNVPYMGHTALLTSKPCILYIYSTNIGTEYFKLALYSPFFFSSKCSLFHNACLFGSCIIHILYTGCAEIKKIIPAPKG